MAPKDELGRYGEEVAVRHLERSGLQILDRNWRCSAGEIDIVARAGAVVVICEVKTRSGIGFGTPLEAVTARKAARLRDLALRWLSERGRSFKEIRFDAIGVLRSPDGAVSIEHVEGVC